MLVAQNDEGDQLGFTAVMLVECLDGNRVLATKRSLKMGFDFVELDALPVDLDLGVDAALAAIGAVSKVELDQVTGPIESSNLTRLSC